LTTVYNSGVRALFLVNSLIEIARIGEGEKDLSLAEIEITPSVNEAVAYWRRNNSAKDVQIEIETSTASPTMYADETQLRQIVSSLVSYVVEFTQDAAKVILTMAEEPDWLVTTIRSVGQKTSSQSALDLEMLDTSVERTSSSMAGRFECEKRRTRELLSVSRCQSDQG